MSAGCLQRANTIRSLHHAPADSCNDVCARVMQVHVYYLNSEQVIKYASQEKRRRAMPVVAPSQATMSALSGGAYPGRQVAHRCRVIPMHPCAHAPTQLRPSKRRVSSVRCPAQPRRRLIAPHSFMQQNASMTLSDPACPCSTQSAHVHSIAPCSHALPPALAPTHDFTHRRQGLAIPTYGVTLAHQQH